MASSAGNLRDWLSVTPPGATPIPWTAVLLCAFSLFNAVLHMTVIFPFQANMLRLFGVQEEYIGEICFDPFSSFIELLNAMLKICAAFLRKVEFCVHFSF